MKLLQQLQMLCPKNQDRCILSHRFGNGPGSICLFSCRYDSDSRREFLRYLGIQECGGFHLVSKICLKIVQVLIRRYGVSFCNRCFGYSLPAAPAVTKSQNKIRSQTAITMEPRYNFWRVCMVILASMPFRTMAFWRRNREKCSFPVLRLLDPSLRLSHDGVQEL